MGPSEAAGTRSSGDAGDGETLAEATLHWSVDGGNDRFIAMVTPGFKSNAHV